MTRHTPKIQSTLWDGLMFGNNGHCRKHCARRHIVWCPNISPYSWCQCWL